MFYEVYKERALEYRVTQHVQTSPENFKIVSDCWVEKEKKPTPCWIVGEGNTRRKLYMLKSHIVKKRNWCHFSFLISLQLGGSSKLPFFLYIFPLLHLKIRGCEGSLCTHENCTYTIKSFIFKRKTFYKHWENTNT